MKHGMAAEVVVPEDSPAFLARREAWAREYRPSGEAEAWALDRAVAASLRIELCERSIDELAASDSERARLCWDEDREDEAAALASGLARSPAVVARKLATTDQGAAILIEMWIRLDASLDDGGWSEADCSTALDLLGLPAALRSGPTPIDDPECGDLLAFRRAIVDREIARLDALRDRALIELDQDDRRRAIRGDLALLGHEARRMLRYERDAWRHYRESVRELPAPMPSEVPGPVAVAAPPAPTPPPPPAEDRPAPARPIGREGLLARILQPGVPNARYNIGEALNLAPIGPAIPGANLAFAIGAAPGLRDGTNPILG